MPEDQEAREALLRSEEKRWLACDQLVYIVCAVLHPGIKLSPFNTNLELFINAHFVEALEFLYYRFFQTYPPVHELYSNFEDYKNGSGLYKRLSGQLLRITSAAAAEVSAIAWPH